MEELMNEFTKFCVNVVLPIIGTIASYYVMVLIKKFETKTNIDINLRTEGLLMGLAEQGVQYAAERSKFHMKQVGKEWTSHEKLTSAIDFIMKRVDLSMPETKLDKFQVEEYITAALARIPGEGATKDKVLK